MPDWNLDRAITERIIKLLGQLEVDLMANSRSHKVKVYLSALEDNEATGLETFTENWIKSKLAYIFSPQL